ncbi:MAG TPA: potassium transporter Kup [Stellaceae bacterium]|nr:potassium transporter Kup [Stellaceae bacterium]
MDDQPPRPPSLTEPAAGDAGGGKALAHDSLRALTIAALGVVYGDIGTSPLYAVRLSLNEFGEVSREAILGVISLITWSLILVVTIKYVVVIMRADNRGEGGLLALTALTLRNSVAAARSRWWIMAAGLVGAALFYGDGVITPAISVLSAVEGLKIATPIFDPYVVPISLALLIGLFLVQRRGTAAVGGLFGPIMLLWFVVLALIGAADIAQHPEILLGLNPWYGIALLLGAPWPGFVMLGAVFLAVTGAETLYADMGHFGRQPLRIAWLYLVLPALLLNYFGQGAVLLSDATTLQNPFYNMVPSWALYPLVGLASVATIIASQAVISGAFSITRQAIQLGYLPRLQILHTSEQEIGQVYVPKINSGLLVAIVALVIGFQTSDSLGAAYGIAVTGMMVITSGLAFVYMRSIGWSRWAAGAVFGFFLLIDLTFLSANLLKIIEGGWVPVMIAGVMFGIMSTWWRGRAILTERRGRDALPVEVFLDGIQPDHPPRVAGTAVIMTRDIDQVPTVLLHALKHYKVLHERIVLMSVVTRDEPHVPDDERLEIRDLGKGFFTVLVWYGFMDEPNLLRALAQMRLQQFRFSMMETSFIIGREKLVPSRRRPLLSRWRRGLFMLMSNNALDATEFFRIPPNRVVELGGQIEI